MLYAVYTVLALGLLGLDQGVKRWVEGNLALGEVRPLWGRVLELQSVRNFGAAWSSFSGQRWLLAAVTAGILVLLGVLVARKTVRHPLGLGAIFLIFAGGVGNLLDRVRLGYVVDMLHFPFWPSYPTFNVADVCIVTGCCLGAIYYLFLYDKTDGKRGSHGNDAARP